MEAVLIPRLQIRKLKLKEAGQLAKVMELLSITLVTPGP